VFGNIPVIGDPVKPGVKQCPGGVFVPVEIGRQKSDRFLLQLGYIDAVLAPGVSVEITQLDDSSLPMIVEGKPAIGFKHENAKPDDQIDEKIDDGILKDRVHSDMIKK